MKYFTLALVMMFAWHYFYTLSVKGFNQWTVVGPLVWGGVVTWLVVRDNKQKG